MMRLLYITLFIFFLYPSSTFAQNEQEEVKDYISNIYHTIDSSKQKGLPYTKQNLDSWITLANFYLVTNNFLEVRNCAENAINCLNNIKIDKKSKTYNKIYIMYLLSTGNLALGNIEGAKKYCLEGILELKPLEQEKDTFYLKNNLHFASLYLDLQEPLKAGELIKKVLEYYTPKNIECTNYADALTLYARYQDEVGSTYLAIKYSDLALKIIRKANGVNSLQYAIACSNIANLYANNKNYSKAIEHLQTTINFYKDSGFEYSTYLYYVKQLLEYEYKAKQYDRIKTDLQLVTDSLISQTKKNFLYQNTYERENSSYGLKNFLNFTLVKYAVALQDSTLWGTVYNALLFSKGLMLTSNQEIAKQIVQSKNPILNEEYQNLTELKAQIKKEQDNNNFFKAKKLTEHLNTQESLLLKKLATTTNYTDNLSTTWQNIQTYMTKDEAAIEFCVSGASYNLNYGALLIKKDLECPIYIPLFTIKEYVSDEIKEKQKQSFYQIWHELSKQLQNIKTVYFSPIGEINNYPIEYFAPQEMASTLFYRVSSTKELIQKEQTYNIQKAILLGGIDYEASHHEIQEANKQNHITNTAIHHPLNIKKGNRGINRGALVPLKGTLEECKNISDILKEHHIEEHLYTGIGCSEEIFKSLSNKNIDLIHIATHGFYWEGKELEDNKNQKFITLTSEQIDKGNEEAEILTHSGLLLSGAYKTLREEQAKDTDDGILTSQEIALLNLQSVKLVVLSACDTGLGDYSGEGVLGLQRGFKQAGVHSILMSLWKVDDEATQILMSQFYHSLFNGETKNDIYRSLLKAQKFLRSYNNGKFNQPKYWAGFVLLDSPISTPQKYK